MYLTIHFPPKFAPFNCWLLPKLAPILWNKSLQVFFDNATFWLVTLTLPFPRFEPWSRNVFVSTVHNGWWKKCFTQNVAWSYLILRFDRWSVLDLDLICCRFLSILPTLPVTPFLLLLQAFFWIWTMSESGWKKGSVSHGFESFPA